jgi:hypothetical protein
MNGDESPVVELDVYPTGFAGRDAWMPWSDWDRKQPNAEAYSDAENPYSWSDPANWTNFDHASRVAQSTDAAGIGFVLQQPNNPYDGDPDPFVAIDYDDVRDPDTGRIHPVVREHIERAGTYADISYSATGVHIDGIGKLPEGVRTIDDDLPSHPDFPDAEIEVYDGKRFMAFTGRHIEATPRDVRDCQTFVDELVEEFVTLTESTPDGVVREPEKTAAEIADVETTDEIQDVFDAIQHIGPGDVSLRSPVTEQRSDGSKSRNPSWDPSERGDKLAEFTDGWVLRDGMIGLDALQVVALEERIVSSETDYPSGEAFFQAIEALRERGAHVPEFDGSTQSEDAERVVVMPNAPVEIVERNAREWGWREAAEQHGREDGGEDGLSIDSARERTREAIADAYRYGDRVLVDALPTLGKSYGTIAAAADTGEPVSYLTNRGNDEQYERARERCEKFGLSYYTLPSAWRNCPCFRGDHGEDVAADVQQAYNNGATAKEIHIHAPEYLGYELPCQHEGGCEWQAKWGFDPEDYDVLIGHYSHAHVNSVVTSRTVAFDEFPGGSFETTLDESLAGVVSHFLSHTPALDIEDYADLMVAREDEQRRADALGWFMQSQQPGRDPGLAFAEGGHALAPLATFTLLAAAKNDLGNGWEHADLEDVGGKGWVGLHDRGQGAIHILRPPSFQYSSALVALDGTPTRLLWKLALGLDRLNTRQVLADDERVEYLRDVLEHRYVRTTDWIKPYSSGENVNARDDAALLDWIRQEYDRTPALITSRNAKFAYHDDEELDFRLALDEHGQLDPNRIVETESCVSAAKHYGNLLGSGDFETERLGAVIGSRHFGDGFVKKWAAYAAETTERVDRSENGKGSNLQYTGLGDAIHRHMTEHQTLQAAMRFGRDGNGALTFVHTNTLPEWVDPVVCAEGRLVTAWSGGMKDVLDVAKGLNGWRTREIADHPDVGIEEWQVRQHLHTLVDRGYVSREVEGNGFVWRDDGLHRVGEHGDVELESVELDELTAEESGVISGTSIYTWDHASSPGEWRQETAALTDAVGSVTDASTTTQDRPDPPPDEAD